MESKGSTTSESTITTNTEQTVAQALVHQLKRAGTEIVFGLPGGENVDIIDALRSAGIRFVLVRNESSAVYMADVYARLTGKPGVCVTTLGPGATNAFVGVAHAHLDRAPVLIITAETNQSYLPGHTHQVLDLQRVFEPITKMTASISPENVNAVVQQALTLTTAGRPGPVHLSVSREMAVEPAALSHFQDQNVAVPFSDEHLETAVNALSQSERPVIVAGVGLEPERPYAALQNLAEAASAPVIVLPKSKGAISDRHPLAAGTIGLTRTDPVYEILDEADCILAVGFDVVELVKPWDQTQPTIWIAPWQNEDASIPAVAELVGPMASTLEKLADQSFETDPTWGATRVAQFRQALAQRELPKPHHGRMRPQEVLAALRQNLPDETLITTDVGSHKICTALEWPAYTPNRYMLSNGLSAMSFGLTGAIAGALTLGQPTVCITGDAGFGMVMGELSLLTEYNLPVITIVMNDSALDLIRAAQHRAGNPTFGTEFTNPDFGQIAEAFGVDFCRVADEQSCGTAVQAAVTSRRPTIIEAVIDPISYPTTVQTQ